MVTTNQEGFIRIHVIQPLTSCQRVVIESFKSANAGCGGEDGFIPSLAQGHVKFLKKKKKNLPVLELIFFIIFSLRYWI